MEPIIEPKKSGIIDKNKMQGIDWQIYEKADDGIHVKLVGTKTYQQIFDELTEHLKEVGFVPDEYFDLSPYINDPDAQIPLDTYSFHANADWGGSEGIYIDIWFTTNNKQCEFAIGKTLADDIEAYIKMSRIAAECQLMLNGGLMEIPEDIKSKLYPPEPRSNAGYTIVDSITANGREYVLGINENAPDKYVTWLCADEEYYTWGHYFSNALQAQKDLLERALETVNKALPNKEAATGADCITRFINGEEHQIKLTEDELNRIWDEGDMLSAVNDVIHRLSEREDFAGDIKRITAENMDVIREIADKFRTDRGMGDSYWYEMDEYIDDRKNDFSKSSDNEADTTNPHKKVGMPQEEFDEMKKTLDSINSPLSEEDCDSEDEDDGMDWSG